MGSARVSVLRSAAMSAAVVGKSSELSDLRMMARLAHIFDAGIVVYFQAHLPTEQREDSDLRKACLTNAANGFRKLA
jgi:hypothetical protein